MAGRLTKLAGSMILCLLLVAGCGNMNKADKIKEYIENNRNDEAIAIIESGYNVNRVNEVSELLYYVFTQGGHTEETPLYIACRVGNKEMIFYLLENGADPNLKNEGCSYPLEKYIKEHGGEDDGVIEAFVAAGADVNLGRLATPFCAVMNRFDGADKEQQDIYEKQAVFMLEHGANWRCEPESALDQFEGYTPIHFIAMTDRADTMARFLQYDDARKYIDAKDRFGDTAIMNAARNHKETAYQMLLDFGADPTIEDRYGKTALDYMSE